MIVCASSTLMCTDLRAGSQAYNSTPGFTVPDFVAFNLSVTSFPTSQFSDKVVNGVELAISNALNRLTLPLIESTDVLVDKVKCTVPYRVDGPCHGCV